MEEELKKIKKYYGEEMMHYCRSQFSSILEKRGCLFSLLIQKFYPSKFLYDDLVDNHLLLSFRDYIFSLVGVVETNLLSFSSKVPSPEVLLRSVGYLLFFCQTEEEIQRFKKYYHPMEQLCTFSGGRLESNYVFFAVREDVDSIRREDFPFPRREDAYGTSVISIQFTRDEFHHLSIKNRYNHRVENPDATFSNCLDNIVLGLAESFYQYYHLRPKVGQVFFEIPGYVLACDERFYKYNQEVGNIYYCPNNIVIRNFKPQRLDPSCCLLFDNFILDFSKKLLFSVDQEDIDSFSQSIPDIHQVSVILDRKSLEKQIFIYPSFEGKGCSSAIVLSINAKGEILSCYHPFVRMVGNNYLHLSTALREIWLPNVEEIGDRFLYYNTDLERIYCPKLKRVGKFFLAGNRNLQEVYLDHLENVDGQKIKYGQGSVQFLSHRKVKWR